MKFICTKENLLHTLNLVGPLARGHNNLPILSNVLINVGNGCVEMVSTNLEVGIKTNLRARVESDGSFTVPAKTLSDYIHLLTEEQIEIEQKETNLVVKSGSSSTKIKGMVADDYPTMPDLDEKYGYVVAVNNLRQGLEAGMVAAARNEIRPELAGVYFGFNTPRFNGLVLAATDSYRLSETKIPLIQGNDSVQIIVPLRAVLEIDRVLNLYKTTGGESTIRVWVGENQIALRYEDLEMTSRLVDGKYPDYTVIIPNSFKTIASLPLDAVKNKIKAAGLFTTTGTNAVLFDFKNNEQNMSISSMSSQTGEHTSIVEGSISGEGNIILLNHRYVLDGLQFIQGGVEFNVNNQDAPCLLRQTGKDDFLYIVMPIRK